MWGQRQQQQQQHTHNCAEITRTGQLKSISNIGSLVSKYPINIPCHVAAQWFRKCPGRPRVPAHSFTSNSHAIWIKTPCGIRAAQRTYSQHRIKMRDEIEYTLASIAQHLRWHAIESAGPQVQCTAHQYGRWTIQRTAHWIDTCWQFAFITLVRCLSFGPTA